MFKKIFITCIFTTLVYSASNDGKERRERMIITGSTTVLPFAMVVAQNFTKNNGKLMPEFRAKGTVSGFESFCKGESDINMASRVMGAKRRKTCKGVRYVEIQIGYDAMALVVKKGLSFNVTRKSLYYALAKRIPVKGKLVPNDILFWRDVIKNGYSGRMHFYGPPPSAGTFYSFVDLVMYYVGNKLPTLSEYRVKSTKKYVELMTNFRTSVWTEVTDGELAIIRMVKEDEGAIGIIGYNYYLKNQNGLNALSVDGIAFNASNLKTRKYPLIRPLYLYVNIANVKKVENVAGFVESFTSDRALGHNGYLTNMGLLQLTQDQMEISRRFVRYLKRVESSSDI